MRSQVRALLGSNGIIVPALTGRHGRKPVCDQNTGADPSPRSQTRGEPLSAVAPASTLIPGSHADVFLNVCRPSPVYSVPEATDDVVDAFSQSFSPFRLPQRLGDKKPSTDSDLNSKHSVCAAQTERRLGDQQGL